MGQADYELFDLYNENVLKREYFKFFSGKEILPILNWGLSVKYN